MKPNAELARLRRENDELRMKLGTAEKLIGIFRKIFLRGDQPAAASDPAAARAGEPPAAGG